MTPLRPFHVDPTLSAITIAYRNDATRLIADDALPRVPVGQEKFKWTEYPLGEAFTVPETRVGRRGRVQQIEFSGEERLGEVQDYGLETPIPFSDIEAAENARQQGRSSYDPEGHSAMWLTDLVLLAREVRVASIVHNPESYTLTRRLTLAGGSQFSDYENSDPIGTIRGGMAGTLIYRPNTITMGEEVWLQLQTHPHLVNAIFGNLTSKGIITRDAFAELFGFKNVLIGQAWVNLARPGQPLSLAPTWGKHIALTYIDPNARPELGITFGMTAQYGTRVSGRIEDPDVGLQGGYRLRVGERVQEIVIAKDLGYFI